MRIMSRRSAREEADAVADRLLGVNDLVADPAALEPYERAPFSEGFVVQLVQRLRDQDPETTPAVGWLEERLAREGTTADELVREEHQRQGAANVTVRNIITSMRLISDVDWAELFEEVSLVDDDPARRQRFRRDGFRDAQPLPHRHRGARARLRPHGAGDRAPRASRRLGGAQHLRRRAPSARSRLSPDRRRPSRLRAVARLSAARSRVAAGASATAGIARLRRQRCPGGCRRSRSCRCSCCAQVGVAGWPLAAMVAGSVCLPAIDAALALVNRAVTGGFGATLLPGLDAARRRAGASAHAGRRADAADDAARRSRSRSSGSRSTTSPVPRRRSAFRAAVRLDRRRAERRRGRRRRSLAAATEGIARLNRRYPSPARRRSLPAAPPAAGLERERRAMDRLGTQARQAARAEPPAARRDRHHASSTPDRRRRRPTSATSSPSTPTRGCRATRSGD